MTDGSILALRTNVAHWCSLTMRNIDKTLIRNQIRLLDVKWDNCELLAHDQNHFTWRGLHMFVNLLAQKLVLMGVTDVMVLSDSTIAWWNYDKYGNFTGGASRMFVDTLATKGIRANIRAINGSGFRNRYDEYLNFPTMLKNCEPLNRKDTKLLVIGGWNDEGYGMHTLRSSIAELIAVFKDKQREKYLMTIQ